MSDAELRELTDRVAAPLQDRRSSTESAFVFRVRDEWFALPMLTCERALHDCIIHSIPHRRGGVLLGIGNVEGDLLPVVSLASLLGAHGVAATTTGRVLILGWKQRRVAAPVEEIHGVHRYHPDDVQPLPATHSTDAAFTIGLLSWRSHSVGLLDPERVFDSLLRGVA